MKFKNESDKLKSISVKAPVGVYWLTFEPNQVLEVPEGYENKARYHGLVEVGSVKKPEPKVVKKKEKEPLFEKIVSINGIGKKIANEIVEEYVYLSEIKKAIRKKTFQVGGVSEKKQRLLLKL